MLRTSQIGWNHEFTLQMTGKPGIRTLKVPMEWNCGSFLSRHGLKGLKCVSGYSRLAIPPRGWRCPGQVAPLFQGGPLFPSPIFLTCPGSSLQLLLASSSWTLLSGFISSASDVIARHRCNHGPGRSHLPQMSPDSTLTANLPLLAGDLHLHTEPSITAGFKGRRQGLI